MFLVERGQNGLTARELAQMLGAPRTSVADLLKVLEGRGFVAPTAEGHGWRLDFRVAQLGNAYLHEFSVREVGRAARRELSRRTGLTTQMAVLDHSDIVYIERQDASRGQSGPHVVTDIGSRLPAYCTSLGKVLLAFLPAEDLRHVLGQVELARRGPNTITSRTALVSELQHVREAGIAVNNEELAYGLRSIAAGVRSQSGDVVAAINLAVHRSMVSMQDLVARLGPALMKTAGGISANLGYRPEF
jgi:IclR family pca regulon transcriptional regulator